MEFKCVDECSQCCTEREYYPDKKFGKIGVLILPEEKQKMEKIGNELKIKINILPRIGTSKNKKTEPEVLAYQMMGIEKNGNVCPFLDTSGNSKSPHGGFPCNIYNERPLACRAYPLVESNPIMLDEKCKFCKEHKTAEENLNSEIESLLKIKNEMNTNATTIWRYATNVGEEEDKHYFQNGWILEEIQ